MSMPTPAETLQFVDHPGVLIVRLTCERFADSDAVCAKQEILQKLRTAQHRVVIDLTPVAYVASTGLGVLVALRDLVVKHGGALAVFGAHPDMAEIFRLTHLDEALNLRESQDDALSAVA